MTSVVFAYYVYLLLGIEFHIWSAKYSVRRPILCGVVAKFQSRAPEPVVRAVVGVPGAAHLLRAVAPHVMSASLSLGLRPLAMAWKVRGRTSRWLLIVPARSPCNFWADFGQMSSEPPFESRARLTTILGRPHAGPLSCDGSQSMRLKMSRRSGNSVLSCHDGLLQGQRHHKWHRLPSTSAFAPSFRAAKRPRSCMRKLVVSSRLSRWSAMLIEGRWAGLVAAPGRLALRDPRHPGRLVDEGPVLLPRGPSVPALPPPYICEQSIGHMLQGPALQAQRSDLGERRQPDQPVTTRIISFSGAARVGCR